MRVSLRVSATYKLRLARLTTNLCRKINTVAKLTFVIKTLKSWPSCMLQYISWQEKYLKLPRHGEKLSLEKSEHNIKCLECRRNVSVRVTACYQSVRVRKSRRHTLFLRY